MFEFRPPKVQRRQALDHRDFLWSRVVRDEGVTVVKTTAGTYRQESVHNTNADDIDVVYPGGHVILVDDEEAASLTTAGYGDHLTEVPE
jgi:hypothetical protein